MVRITTGKAKNKKLESPEIPGYQGVKEKVKMAIFAILEDHVKEATCLDLFAGSGNLGIEALSRGADYCDFVDKNWEAVKTIQKNLKETEFLENSDVHQQESVKFVSDAPSKYDIIFMDPFYKDVKHKYLMELLPEILNPKGVVVFLHGEDLNIKSVLQNSNLNVVDSRKYGKTFVEFMTHK